MIALDGSSKENPWVLDDGRNFVLLGKCDGSETARRVHIAPLSGAELSNVIAELLTPDHNINAGVSIDIAWTGVAHGLHTHGGAPSDIHIHIGRAPGVIQNNVADKQGLDGGPLSGVNSARTPRVDNTDKLRGADTVKASSFSAIPHAARAPYPGIIEGPPSTINPMVRQRSVTSIHAARDKANAAATTWQRNVARRATAHAAAWNPDPNTTPPK
ncbi:hypothetical protein B0H13DRAFT_2336687 [Mycena leptocephala]|nr:hypothetical protein B0H13DRAFT_2336687 [Mycena leptocephala]